MCKHKTCLDCNYFATCDIVKSNCDEDGRVDIVFLNTYADGCSKYFKL